MLELKKIDKYYNPGTVNEMCLFDGFDLTVADGEFVSVVGSNGSGKTSMLKYPLWKYSCRWRKDPDEWERYYK